MTQTAIADRIERSDFPPAAEGYDREAVDAHLREVAAELAGTDETSASTLAADRVRRIGDTAALRIEEIVGAAEQSAREIIAAAEHAAAETSAWAEHAAAETSAWAESEAREIGARTEATARETTARAEAEARATREAVEAAAAKMREQAGQFAARTTDAAERDARAARESISAQADQLRQALDAAATLLERLGSATSSNRGLHAVESEAVEPEAAEPGPSEAEANEPVPDGPKPSGPRAGSGWLSKRNRDGDDSGASITTRNGNEPAGTDRPHEMRMSAFNMLIRGSSRDDVVESLRERFELGDEDRGLLESVLDQASASATNWRPLPELPVRRRFLRR